MAHVWADRTAETSTTTGTGALTLAAAITGFQRFSAVCSVNDTVTYAIEAVDSNGLPTGDWEVGVGTYSSANTLTRTTVIKSSNSNAAVNFAAGTKYVFLDDIASTRNTLEQFSGTSEPSAPVSGLIHFAKDFNGYEVPYSRGAAGKSGALFPPFTGRPLFAWAQGVSGANPAGVGITIALSNNANASIGSTNTYTRFARSLASSTATASTSGSLRDSTTSVFPRGTNALDGFRTTFRFGLEAIGNTNCRWFVGLLNATIAQTATFDPATALNCIGIGASGTDTTNAKLYYNDGSGSAVAIDLGANYPAKTAQFGVVELILEAAASASAIKYTVRRVDDTSIAPTTGSLSSDIPAAGTAMNPHFTVNNNATAATSQVAFMYYGVETGIG